MPKKFYTEKDIEDLFKSGVKSLSITDDVALTELAYEKANRLGMQLIQDQPDTPPSAPVRPYLSQPSMQTKATPAISAHAISPAPFTVRAANNGDTPVRDGKPDLEARIRNAVIAKLGDQIDPALLDTIIQRVLKSTGLK